MKATLAKVVFVLIAEAASLVLRGLIVWLGVGVLVPGLLGVWHSIIIVVLADTLRDHQRRLT